MHVRGLSPPLAGHENRALAELQAARRRCVATWADLNKLCVCVCRGTMRHELTSTHVLCVQGVCAGCVCLFVCMCVSFCVYVNVCKRVHACAAHFLNKRACVCVNMPFCLYVKPQGLRVASVCEATVCVNLWWLHHTLRWDKVGWSRKQSFFRPIVAFWFEGGLPGNDRDLSTCLCCLHFQKALWFDDDTWLIVDDDTWWLLMMARGWLLMMARGWLLMMTRCLLLMMTRGCLLMMTRGWLLMMTRGWLGCVSP